MAEKTEGYETKKYRVKLDGNRGVTVMKLNEEDKERYGDAVLGLADDQDQPDNALAPGHEDDEQADDTEAETKAKAPANKAKSAKNK